MSIELKPTTSPLSEQERSALLANPGFGRVFTDHMVLVRWDTARGWHDGELVPYGPLSLDPATMVLHYGQEIFEGLKAYAQPDGSVAVFRPTANAERLQTSARRMAMPELPAELFVESVEALVRQDIGWVPDEAGKALYLRPFMIATEVGLGVRPANSYTYLLIASPAGAYFSGGVTPVTVWLSMEYTRAAPGGTGAAKTGGNYSASLAAQHEATQHGCDQVVWLDAAEHRWVEEMGGMNLFFVHGSGAHARLVTPALTGTLLPGITRDSLLTLAADLGLGVEERRISTEEWREGNANGEITEVFACGTAAVLTPVGHVKSAAGSWSVGDGGAGPVAVQLRQTMLDIQHGVAVDRHGWMHRITAE